MQRQDHTQLTGCDIRTEQRLYALRPYLLHATYIHSKERGAAKNEKVKK